MKIAIDCRVVTRDSSGIGIYTKNIVETILKLDNKNQYILIVNDSSILKINKQNVRYFTTAIKLTNHLIGDFWFNFILPFKLKKMGNRHFMGNKS